MTTTQEVPVPVPPVIPTPGPTVPLPVQPPVQPPVQLLAQLQAPQQPLLELIQLQQPPLPVTLGFFPILLPAPALVSVFKPRMTTHFNGNSGEIASFQVSMEQFLNRWGYQFADEVEIIKYISVQPDGAASQWYVNLYRSVVPELYSLTDIFRSMEIQFGEPALTENARTDLKNLKQGSMSVKEYSAKFCAITTNLQGWPESLLVDYYQDGLNVELVCKAINYSNPQPLVDWIQAASEMEARNHLMKSVKQHRSPPQPHKTIVEKGQSRPKPPADLKREQRFKAGHCLTCGGSGHFAASCPSHILQLYLPNQQPILLL